jgi:ABC-2 type transport system permease protein
VRPHPLLDHHWRRHRTALVLLAAGAALFEFIVARVAPTPEQAGFLQGLLRMAPEPVQQMLGEQLAASLTARGFLAFFYAHPFPLLMLAVWAVRLSSGALAGEIGRGTMDLIAARPVSRVSQVGAALVAMAGGLALIAAAQWAGTATGLLVRGVPGVRSRDFVAVAGMAWLLFAAFGAIGLAVSAAAREGGTAVSFTAGLMSVSFALDYLARVWEPIRDLRALSLFRYFDPQGMLLRGLETVDVATLVGVLAVSTLAAFVIFARRNL